MGPEVERYRRERWEIEDDLRTLKRAEEIKRDYERLTDAQNLLREQMAAERSILGERAPKEYGRRRNPATVARLKVRY